MPIEILMPALSPTMSEGHLVKWHKKEGDVIKAGQVLAEIETDKASMDVEAVDEGILGRIVVPEGTNHVKVNALIGLILEEGEDPASLNETGDSLLPLSAAKGVQKVEESLIQQPLLTKSTQESIAKKPHRVFATPLARRIAEQNQINLEVIAGSGPRGRVIKADVEFYKEATVIPKSMQNSLKFEDHLIPPSQDIKVTNIRKVIADRLLESKQTVPHFYLTIECEIDNLIKTRKDINRAAEESSKISVNDFIIKAIAMSLRKVPEANVSWGGDHIKFYDRSDISVAVASETGLITPIVRGADQKSLRTISQEIKDLIVKARTGKLKPTEFQGGTFSLSNLGMYGIKQFSAIINPPQACILAVGAGEARPLIKEGKVEIGTVMNCTLSVDHRCVDGAVGAHFLKSFKQMIENPIMMLI